MTGVKTNIPFSAHPADIRRRFAGYQSDMGCYFLIRQIFCGHRADGTWALPTVHRHGGGGGRPGTATQCTSCLCSDSPTTKRGRN